ncbi:hypothetical protein NliqN6_2461 [Naganishia liquefaciens]|uniref:Anti-proliferative protein domain-containing protein n=1 Tax=Naganishia liquefaciens TaxID=104408 RepID=A0A8H3TTS0_9TREE|nr:hypothetical protein NliqN6_2461 [Naganishia liquefaciens]
MDTATLDPFSQQDLTLGTTLTHLCTFLTRNLGKHYGTQTIARLHDRIRHHLTPRLAPTWDPLNPSSGCGTRSLIAMPGRFPTPLVDAALEVGVDPVVWAKEMNESGEWQLWIDPGSICWRDGGWVWVEDGYERERVYKQTLHTIWQTPIVPFNTDDTVVPNSALSTPRSVSSPFPMRAHSATAALQKQSAQRSQHPQLTTQTAPTQAIRAPAVFRIPMAPFPYPASTAPTLPTKQLGSLSLRDGNDATVFDSFDTSGRAFPRKSGSLPSDGHPGRGVIGMGFGQGFGEGSIGSGLLEGGAPLTKRATAKTQLNLPSKSALSAGIGAGPPVKRSPLTPTTTVSVTTSSHIPPPPFGSGIPGQPGSGMPTSVSHPSKLPLQQNQGLHVPVKRHHLKNWTEAEPNRLVARSKGKTANKAVARSKDEERPNPTSAVSGPPGKAESYSALGRASSSALNAAETASQRKSSAISSCASGADADTERDTSIDDSDEVGNTSEALIFADCVNVGPSSKDISERHNSPEIARKIVNPSPISTQTDSEPARKSPTHTRTTSPSAVALGSSSGEPRQASNSGIRVPTSATAAPNPYSVQGYDGGNVGVLGGGVKLGSVAGSSQTQNRSPNTGNRAVSGQNATGRASGLARSVSGSSAFGTTASESETTIGSGSENGKIALGSDSKKRRGRILQTRSPDTSQPRMRETVPTQHAASYRWSPMNPSRMHVPPVPGVATGAMGIPMLGGGIAGQPGSMGFPIGPGAPNGYNQVYAAGNQGWAPMTVGGLGLPLSSPEAKTTTASFAVPGVKTFVPAATFAAEGLHAQPSRPQFPVFRPQSRTVETPAVGQRHSST